MDTVPLTFEQAIGRVFEFRSPSEGRKRFYVVRGKTYRIDKFINCARIIDLETSTEVITLSALDAHIPAGWKEILP
jgi:hypothetical protein